MWNSALSLVEHVAASGRLPYAAPQVATAESTVSVSLCELSFVMLSPEVLLYVHVHVLGRPRVSGWPCPGEILNSF